MRDEKYIAYIFGAPLMEDSQTVEKRNRVDSEAQKLRRKTETWKQRAYVPLEVFHFCPCTS